MGHCEGDGLQRARRWTSKGDGPQRAAHCEQCEEDRLRRGAHFQVLHTAPPPPPSGSAPPQLQPTTGDHSPPPSRTHLPCARGGWRRRRRGGRGGFPEPLGAGCRAGVLPSGRRSGPGRVIDSIRRRAGPGQHLAGTMSPRGEEGPAGGGSSPGER